jgi:PHD/YefM family antitoxin component YafN of YafNO toxin-antitoxin module
MREVIEHRQPVIVERGGKPQVVVLSVAEYERLVTGQTKQVDWKELVRRAREQVHAELGERKLPPPEDIIREMREERDAQLMDLR